MDLIKVLFIIGVCLLAIAWTAKEGHPMVGTKCDWEIQQEKYPHGLTIRIPDKHFEEDCEKRRPK